MNRKSFIVNSSILASGFHFKNLLSFPGKALKEKDLYSIFKNPPASYKPFVRWWWNGDKIERNELARELRLLKEAGIGGVEINPIKFPAKTDDLNKPSLQWLSPEWIDLLAFTFEEARSLGMTCDLIVGSGWPFGAEWLEGEERSMAMVMVVGTKKLEGPLDYEVSLSDLYKEADPAINSPFPGRTMKMISVHLAPSIINTLDDVKDLTAQIPNEVIRCTVPQGKYVLYALVEINGFMQVIQGAPGANGPVLNHYNEAAVRKYLMKMSETIQQKAGPLSSHIRSLFIDSLELEGSNWCMDLAIEFQKRRGYDLMPWLPFLLFKIVAMGNTCFYDHGAEYGPAFRKIIQRIRYDFELTKVELIKQRFVDVIRNWCQENNVRSRAQAYGRGYFPLEGSFEFDIPECETWIRPGLGTEMSSTDYCIGRAYTVVNKYVSSAAHLKGKTLVSCEELTNIHLVFNETLELMKIAGDQSIISGVTHPVFHGFNYSPPDAAYPGWVIYGTFINERNPWWPYFNYFTQYKTRLSAILQQATMYADMAILPATADLWSFYSAQNDPFPAVMYPDWQPLIWESIHQNGNACDYISEQVLQDCVFEDGFLVYDKRKYHTLFLAQVDSIDPLTAKKLFDLVQSGGKIFFIESYPSKAPGWKDHEQRDKEVQDWINKLKAYPDHYTFLDKPGEDHSRWFKVIQEKYKIDPYVKIDQPNKFITQVRYQTRDAEMLLLINSNMNASYEITITVSKDIISGKQAWIWNAENGERYKIATNSGAIRLYMGPADLKLLVFDGEKKGPVYDPPKQTGPQQIELRSWAITGQHVNGNTITKEMDELKDLKEIPGWINFCGSIIYRNNLMLDDKTKFEWLNLGKVFGVSELFINGTNAGAKWYGRRIYAVRDLLKNGTNIIEIKTTTTMGNYLKSLADNPIGQFWTNAGRTIQPLQPIGMVGPVTLY